MKKKGNQFSYQKLTQKEWLMMEQELPTMQLKVCAAMKCLGQNDYAQQAKTLYFEKNKYFICGDTLYLSEIQTVLKKQFPDLFSAELSKQVKGKGKKPNWVESHKPNLIFISDLTPNLSIFQIKD